MPIAGKLSDFGRRLLLLDGISVFTVGSSKWVSQSMNNDFYVRAYKALVVESSWQTFYNYQRFVLSPRERRKMARYHRCDISG